MQYNNTLFIITGASKGIGKGIAEKALQEGAHVIGVNRTHSIKHENYIEYTLDLTNLKRVEEQFPKLLEDQKQYKSIFLINNAGTLGDINHLGQIENSSISLLFDLNVSAPMILMNLYIKELKQYSGKKVIINISSGAGKNPVDGWSGYCASKAALDMATQVAAKEAEIDQSDFIIKAIAPGVVDTEMQTQIRGTDKEAFSSVQKFKDLKENQELDTEEGVASKFFKIFDKIDQFKDTLLDVRNI